MLLLVTTKVIFILELSHDGNVCYDRILHQSAISCVNYVDSWFNTG